MLRGEGHEMRRREFLRRAGLGMAALAAAPSPEIGRAHV